MPAGDLWTYNPAQCIVIVNGIPMGGWGQDDMLSFEPNSDLSSHIVSPDGVVTRSILNDLSGLLRLTLGVTSQSNDALDTLTWLTKTVAVGDVFSVKVRDLNSRREFFGEKVFPRREPDFMVSREAPENEWLFTVAKATIRHRGAFR